jgi:multidrug resistance protein, MATE family
MSEINQNTLKSYKIHFTETWQLSLPVVVGQVGTVLLGVIDAIMIGVLGHVALSAVTLSNNIYFAIVVLPIAGLNVVTALVAESEGANNTVQSGKYLPQGVYVALIFGLFSGIITFRLSFLLPYMGQPPEEIGLIGNYLRIWSVSTIPLVIYLAYKQFCDGLSRTMPAMICTIVGLLINVGLNYLLVYGNWGFPKMGINGAACASFISRVLVMCAMIIYVHKSDWYAPFRTDWMPDWVDIRKMVVLGLPMGIQVFFELLVFTGAAFLLGWLPDGSIARAAHQIAINICSVTFMVVSGFAAGGCIRVGNAKGSHDMPNLRRAGVTALLLGVGFMMVASVLMVIFREEIVLLHGITDARVVEIAMYLMLFGAAFQVFDGAQAIGAGLLRGMQDVKFPTWVTFIVYSVLSFPLVYYLGFTLKWGLTGVWIAFILALAGAAVLMVGRFFWLVRR